MITVNGGNVGSGVVALDGTFSISVGGALSNGDVVEAHGGSATGPSLGSVTVVTGSGTAATPIGTVSGGASVITVNGAPGETVLIVGDPDGPGPAVDQVLGSAVVGPSGQVAVWLDTPLQPGGTFDVLMNGHLEYSGVAGPLGPAPVIVLGAVIEEGSVISGTGVPGSTVYAVDDQGLILGSVVVDAQGNFLLPVSGAVAGHQVKVIQDGVEASRLLSAFKMGGEKGFLSTNIFKPGLGPDLDLSFKPDQDDHVTVKIFNAAAELIRPVVEMDVKAGVLYGAKWDGKNAYGEGVASGIYVVSVYGKTTRILKKVIVIH